MKRFWELIIDDKQNTFEIIGTSTNDTLLTNNVFEMQNSGMKVRCQTPSIDIPEKELTIRGYTIEENLYSRLLDEYESVTKKQLKRW